MATDSPVSGLTQEEYNFIAAVIEDENAEYPLDDEEEYILFTDWEGDGTFFPSVTILHTVDDAEKDSEQETLDTLLEEVDWFYYDEIEGIEDDNSGNMSHAYFYGSRIDSDTREEVEATL